MGMRTVDELIDAGVNETKSLDELSRIKICWSPGKKGNSQELEQAKFSVKDTVITRKMLDETPILSHRAGECVIDFCPDLLWRDILLRILSEAGFSNKDIRDRFCLNGSFSDRATVAKRLSAALGKDTNPPRGEGKKAALDWCETNRDDFDNYQAYFGKRPVVVPRTPGPEEQILRAEGFARLGLATLVDPRRVDPTTLWAAIESELAGTPPTEMRLAFDGREQIARKLAGLAAGRAAEPDPA